MTRARDVKRILRLARWVYAGNTWSVTPEGNVVNEGGAIFDMNNPVIDNAWRMKLGQETGWRIEKRARGYVATNGKGGFRESPDLLTLIEICLP